MLPRPFNSWFFVDGVEIEFFRIEFSADPLQELLVLIVLGIIYRLQKIDIAPYSAYVFRRAGVLSRDASRVMRSGLGLHDLLQNDFVLP